MAIVTEQAKEKARQIKLAQRIAFTRARRRGLQDKSFERFRKSSRGRDVVRRFTRAEREGKLSELSEFKQDILRPSVIKEKITQKVKTAKREFTKFREDIKTEGELAGPELAEYNRQVTEKRIGPIGKQRLYAQLLKQRQKRLEKEARDIIERERTLSERREQLVGNPDLTEAEAMNFNQDISRFSERIGTFKSDVEAKGQALTEKERLPSKSISIAVETFPAAYQEFKRAGTGAGGSIIKGESPKPAIRTFAQGIGEPIKGGLTEFLEGIEQEVRVRAGKPRTSEAKILTPAAELVIPAALFYGAGKVAGKVGKPLIRAAAEVPKVKEAAVILQRMPERISLARFKSGEIGVDTLGVKAGKVVSVGELKLLGEKGEVVGRAGPKDIGSLITKKDQFFTTKETPVEIEYIPSKGAGKIRLIEPKTKRQIGDIRLSRFTEMEAQRLREVATRSKAGEPIKISTALVDINLNKGKRITQRQIIFSRPIKGIQGQFETEAGPIRYKFPFKDQKFAESVGVTESIYSFLGFKGEPTFSIERTLTKQSVEKGVTLKGRKFQLYESVGKEPFQQTQVLGGKESPRQLKIKILQKPFRPERSPIKESPVQEIKFDFGTTKTTGTTIPTIRQFKSLEGGTGFGAVPISFPEQDFQQRVDFAQKVRPRQNLGILSSQIQKPRQKQEQRQELLVAPRQISRTRTNLGLMVKVGINQLPKQRQRTLLAQETLPIQRQKIGTTIKGIKGPNIPIGFGIPFTFGAKSPKSKPSKQFSFSRYFAFTPSLIGLTEKPKKVKRKSLVSGVGIRPIPLGGFRLFK